MNEQEIFTAAAFIENSALRESFLTTVCRGDETLKLRIQQLLQASRLAEHLMEKPQQALGQLAAAASLEEVPSQAVVEELQQAKGMSARMGTFSPGMTIGNYQILQLLGEGGMGVVYAAKQSEPVKRQVALKILRPTDTSRNVLARFEQERHALAMMDHPGIARILDAGTTSDGLPYFVMELVKGIPINQYCDQENLSPQERLELFIPVCSAVQHAHQKGIIHRDLKPSNILVGLYDGKPVPKVIDFGVAKAIGLHLSESTIYTEIGSIVGTLEYMSPEQAELNNLDIDTRADIYSLGVLLYELLTGSPPFSRQQLRSAAFDEMLRIIREVEPPKPSTKVSSAKEIASVAAHRKLEPKQLARALSGDLDWVVMKALAKERTHRYQTVGEFSEDIDRFLRVQTVVAGPPGFAYRAKRFLKRNKILSIAMSIALMAIVAGGIGTTYGMLQAWAALDGERRALNEKTAALRDEEIARTSAELANQKTLEALSSLTDSFTQRWLTRQEELSTEDRAFLEKILVFYQDVAKTNPDTNRSKHIQVSGLHKLADLHAALGNSEESLESYRQAARLYQVLANEFPEFLGYVDGEARCLRAVAKGLTKKGKQPESENAHRRALELLSGLIDSGTTQPATQIEYVESLTDFGSRLHEHGKNVEAETVFQQAEAAFHNIGEEVLDEVERHSLQASMLQIRCYFFRATGRFREALADGQKAIELHTALISSGVDTVQIRRELCSLQKMLGSIHQGRGEYELAETRFREALVAAQSLAVRYPLVPAHRVAVAESHRMLGTNFYYRRNFAKAIEQYQQAKVIAQRIMDDFPSDLEHQHLFAELNNVMGLALKDSNQLVDAQRELQASVLLKKKVVERSSNSLRYCQSLAMSLHNLANTHSKLHDYNESANCHREAIAIRTDLFAKSPEIVGLALDLGGSHCDFGKMLVDSNRLDEGVEQLDLAVNILETTWESNTQQVITKVFLRNSHQNRGIAYMQMENWHSALADFEKALELDEGPNQVRLRQQRLICVCHIDPDQGIEAADALLELENAGFGDSFAAARAFAQISGTHTDSLSREKSAQRAIDLLQSLYDAGVFNDPAIVTSLDRHAELRHLNERPAYKTLIKIIRKQP
ncbi:MAG: protein kinase [Pirellulaceae bacterium]|nr:protein kinase [Pirellulaceae bacterium]